MPLPNLKTKIKIKLFNLFNQSVSVFLSVKAFYGFILRMLGWAILVCLLIFLTLGFSAAIASVFGQKLQFGDVVLFITAVFVLAYTYETKKLREETIFQRKISAANDIQFEMIGEYKAGNPKGAAFGTLKTVRSTNSIVKFSFLRAIPMKEIGYCSKFIKWSPSDTTILADYFMPTAEEREIFLKALQLQNGEIKASVLTTNGTRFVYTFQTLNNNWKEVLKGKPGFDNFILVEKRLDINEL